MSEHIRNEPLSNWRQEYGSAGNAGDGDDPERQSITLRYPRKYLLGAIVGGVLTTSVLALFVGVGVWHFALSEWTRIVSVSAVATIGIGLVVVANAPRFVNRTLLRVEDEVLVIVKGPLPWPRKLLVRLSEVADVAVRQRQQSHSAGTARDWTISRYDVLVVTSSGGQIVLLRSLPKIMPALRSKEQVQVLLGRAGIQTNERENGPQ